MLLPNAGANMQGSCKVLHWAPCRGREKPRPLVLLSSIVKARTVPRQKCWTQT